MKKTKKNNNKFNIRQIIVLLIFAIIIVAGSYFTGNDDILNEIFNQYTVSYELSNIPEYTGNPYVTINNNIPYFTEDDYTTEPFEKYSKFGKHQRCGIAYANICKEIMPSPNDKREALSYDPTGWEQEEYEDIIDGNYLYHRCHLIGWQLAGENNNKYNLITGTQYMNIEGMLDFENSVADYIDENEENHVLYRVTPIFEDDNLVASGVQMEAYSVEDNGKLHFNVYVYNVQPGIEIDYATGKSKLAE